MTTVRAIGRTAHRDQSRAAARDAHRRLADIAARLGIELGASGHPWLARQLAGLQAALAAGIVRTCPHLHGGPAVVYAALWAPGRLVCQRCLPVLVPDAVQDRTCDRCQNASGQLTIGVMHAGPLLVAFGLCPACTRPPGPGETSRSAAAGSDASHPQHRRVLDRGHNEEAAP
jgi:hypothetical protein